VVELIKCRTVNGLTFTQNLHDVPILFVLPYFPTLKARTGTAIPAFMVATTANVKTATDVNESMIVRTPNQNLTIPRLTITVEHHATANYTTNHQSLPSLLP
jgi:hypothetical protein